jgi:tetratricopeptide (TPR) repeat protein
MPDKERHNASATESQSQANPAIRLANVFCQRVLQTVEESKKHLSENTAQGALARGKVFSLAAEYEQAAASFAEALSMDNNLTEAAARLPLAQLKAGQNAKALNNAMSLAARQPKFMVQELSTNEKVSAMTILGESLLANGRIQDATEAYKNALQISSEDSYAAGRLAQLHMVEGRGAEALKLAGNFTSNPRASFQSLNKVMPLGNTSVSLLPRITAETLVANVSRSMPGRPILADGAPRVAPLVWDDNGWCAEIPPADAADPNV